MSDAFDLYAAPPGGLENARRLLEQTLQVALALHDSSWRGGDYYLGAGRDKETFTLQRNRLDGDEPSEQKYPDTDTILYVEHTQRSEKIRALLEATGFNRLRHSTL